MTPTCGLVPRKARRSNGGRDVAKKRRAMDCDVRPGATTEPARTMARRDAIDSDRSVAFKARESVMAVPSIRQGGALRSEQEVERSLRLAEGVAVAEQPQHAVARRGEPDRHHDD